MRALNMLLVGALVLGLACSGCPSTATVEPPPRGASAVEPLAEPAPPSVVVIAALIPPARLRALIEDAVPTALLKEEGRQVMGDVVADIAATRSAEVRVLLREDSLRFDVPVDVKADVYRQKRGGGRGAALGKGRAELILQITLELRIRSDWTFVPTSTVSYRWQSSPTLRLGGLKLDLGDMLDKRLEAGLPALKQGIDDQIRSTTVLREQATDIWEALHAPRSLRRQPPLWLHFAPTHLFASDPAISGRGLALTLGVDGTVAVTSQRDGAPDIAALPPRGRPPIDTPATRLRVPLEIGWPVLLKQARDRLEGQMLSAPLPADTGTATATVSEVIDLYPSGDRLAVGLRLTGAVDTTGTTLQAEAWLLGRPVLDVSGQVLRLEDFTYTAATDRRAANLALEALRERVQEAVAAKLIFPLEDTLTPLREELGRQLAAVPLDGGVVLSGTVDGLRLAAVHLRDEALIVDTDIEATLSVQLGPGPEAP